MKPTPAIPYIMTYCLCSLRMVEKAVQCKAYCGSKRCEIWSGMVAVGGDATGIIPCKAWKKIFTFIFQLSGWAPWHRALKTRKCRFSNYLKPSSSSSVNCGHVHVAANWSSGRTDKFVDIGRNVVVASKSGTWSGWNPTNPTGDYAPARALDNWSDGKKIIKSTQCKHAWYHSCFTVLWRCKLAKYSVTMRKGPTFPCKNMPSGVYMLQSHWLPYMEFLSVMS